MLIKATKKHRNIAVDILTNSFLDITVPTSINYVVGFGTNRSKKMRKLMKYQFDVSLISGSAYLDENMISCILYLQKKNYSMKLFFLDLKLIFTVIGLFNIFKVLKREKILKSYHPKENFVHLWLMGTKKKHQGQGTGTKLLKETCKIYKKKTIYVETTTNSNLKFYKKNGFFIYANTEVLNYPLYFLKNV